ncbi:MAG TPA: glycosyltransferase family A protein [Anaeromyxobacter sp.]|nr:glycosyltransferase family A protein [Anaeromyxobacter sp.]
MTMPKDPSPGQGAAAPAVSVVIPCYRQAQFLGSAVQSLVSQTFTSWEAIVVDDGSPDETVATARELAARHPSRVVRLVRQRNGGLAAARNAGIKAARGSLILPLDADDAIHPTFLERTVAALAAAPRAAIAFTDVVLFGAEAKIWKMGPFSLEALRQRNRACCTSLFRRRVWEAVGGYNPNMVYGYEDWDFWIGASLGGFEAVHVRAPLFFYRMKGGSMVSRALEHHAQLCARVILNHPRAFGERDAAQAAKLLAAAPLPPPPTGAASAMGM